MRVPSQMIAAYSDLMAAQIARWRFRIKSQTLVPSVECRAIYGLNPDAPLSFSHYLDAVHPDDRETQRSSLAAAIERTGKYDLEHRITWADGSVHRVRIMGSLTYEDDGTPFELVGASMLMD
jgi:PAS domain-containing protein